MSLTAAACESVPCENLDPVQVALRRYFGYESFRPGQEEVIRHLLAGRDTMAIMPTGGGKSICYQLPALLLPGVTLVVSPLISLMQDQVTKLLQQGIPAAFINSSQKPAQAAEVLNQVRAGEIKLLYVAPERFGAASFREALRHIRVSLFAVDEAHCISQWGHDFRPAYLKLRRAIHWCGSPVVGAFTATATPQVREDIVLQLKLEKPAVIVSGFDRPNLKYLTVNLKEKEKKEQTLRILQKIGASSIVYCSTQKAVNQVTQYLRENKVSCGMYHGGMLAGDRSRIQNRFLSGDLQVIVATNAFGMGIDKPDIRLIVHYNMPGSIEAYYQESGRAGRDGQPAYCVLFGNGRDLRIQQYFLEGNHPSESLIRNVYEMLFSFPENPVLRTYKEIAHWLPGKVNDMGVGSAIKALEKEGYVQRLMDKNHPAYIHLSLPFSRLIQRNQRHPVRLQILQYMQTLAAPEAWSQSHPLILEQVMQDTGLSREGLSRNIRALANEEGFHYTPAFSGRGLQKMKAPVPVAELAIDFQALAEARKHQEEKIFTVDRYLKTRSCKRDTLLSYFGETTFQPPCNACGSCLRWSPVSFLKDNSIKKSESDSGTSAMSTIRRAKKSTALKLQEEDVRTFLCCMLKYDQKLGMTTLIALLRGSKNRAVRNQQLEQCTFYGRMQHVPTSVLTDFCNQELQSGAIKKNRRKYPKLMVTETGKDKYKAILAN